MLTQTVSRLELRQELHRLIDLLPTERIADLHEFIMAQPLAQRTPIDEIEHRENFFDKPKLPRLVLQPATTLRLFTETLSHGYEGDALDDTESL